MASTSPDASEIRRRGRQRLIGAVAIALLLIVFVPMLLDSEPRPGRDGPTLDIPPKDNAPPLPAPPAATADKAPVAAAPEKSAEEAKKPAAKVAVVEPKAAPAKAAPAPAAAKVAAATPAKEGFVVQVGAFADDGHLSQVKGKLALANIEAYTERAGSLTRLRVGPFPTKEAAEKSAADVRKVVPDAKVVPLP
jgi:DedD protein